MEGVLGTILTLTRNIKVGTAPVSMTTFFLTLLMVKIVDGVKATMITTDQICHLISFDVRKVGYLFAQI